MGQRANLILVENQQYTLYYDHWCANSLDQYLFWGPEKAVAFIKGHEKQGEEWWLDDVWCEGGAVIDLDKRLLLWFGGEDISYEIPLRRVLLELMETNWEGWEIRWAYEGVADLVDYVGYDRQKVIAVRDTKHIFDKKKVKDTFNCRGAECGWDNIITIKSANDEAEIFLTNITFSLTDFLMHGSALLDLRNRENALLRYSCWFDADSYLMSGIHIDTDTKQLMIWSCTEEVIDFDQLLAAWPGYTITYHRDCYEIQAELSGGRLCFNNPPRLELIQRIRKIVCRDTKDPLGTLKSLTEMLESQGRDLEVSPAVYIAETYPSDKASQEEWFDKYFG